MAKSVRIEKRIRTGLFLLITTSWITGILFFILDNWLWIEGEFGPEKNPLQFPTLKIHAASAFLLMIGFGFLLASHVLVSFPVKRMRPTGIALLSTFGFLIVSAYGLYYIGDDSFRQIVVYAHAGAGCFFPILLATHLLKGKAFRKRIRRQTTSRKAA